LPLSASHSFTSGWKSEVTIRRPSGLKRSDAIAIDVPAESVHRCAIDGNDKCDELP
jgi:hypothetical protein